MKYDILKTQAEIAELLQLQQKNLKKNISKDESKDQGFVTVVHTEELLQTMLTELPQIIALSGSKLVAYALSMNKHLEKEIPILEPMFKLFNSLNYGGRPLNDYSYYVMGQICIDKDFRGQGIFDGLYAKHKEVFSDQYQLLVTEIATSNTRSMAAHNRVGFKIVHTYRDLTDEWNIVVWEF